MHYIYYETESGEFVLDRPTLRAGWPNDVISVFVAGVEPNWNLVEWNPTLRMLQPKTPTGRTILSQIEFSFRWTTEERQTLHAMRLDPATPLVIRAALEDAERLTDRSKNGIDLEFPPTAELVDGILDILVAANVVTDKEVRYAAIMSPAPL